jgi:hypothetical protein
MDELDFDSFYAAARTYQDRRLGAGSLCDRCDHGHIYRRRGARDVAVYCGASARRFHLISRSAVPSGRPRLSL